jgi:hypothetical protein
MFASKTPRELNRDPRPNVSPNGQRFGSGLVAIGGCTYSPRPEYDYVQHNRPNPILARFRKWIEGETLADPSWIAEWLDAMADPDVNSAAAIVLDELYETPYRRRERAEQEAHARRVLHRLASLHA